MGSGASVVDVAEQIVTTYGNDYLQYRARIEEQGIDGNKLANITQQEISIVFDQLGITNPKHRESLMVSLAVRNLDLPTHVTTIPRKLMGDLFAIQGISLDPSDVEPVVTKITHAIGCSGCDGVNSFDVFINYRVATDADLAEKLYLYLKDQGIRAFLDKKCLKDGEPWKVGFLKGLLRSRKFLCLVSSDALTSVRDRTKNHTHDNVLLEYETAFMIKKLLEDVNVDMANSYIIPVLVGKAEKSVLTKFADFDLSLYPDSLTAIAADGADTAVATPVDQHERDFQQQKTTLTTTIKEKTDELNSMLMDAGHWTLTGGKWGSGWDVLDDLALKTAELAALEADNAKIRMSAAREKAKEVRVISGARGHTSFDSYEGQVDQQHRPHGLGRASYLTGDKYEGEWVHGKREGNGACTMDNGDMYAGRWEDDIFRRGTKLPRSKDYSYAGDFHGLKLEGVGKFEDHAFNVYVGQFGGNGYEVGRLNWRQSRDHHYVLFHSHKQALLFFFLSVDDTG